ncbi:MAG: PTS transporter subunit EIIC [Erysipelotrichales bacterium]|nr:PTS transporter subunit EIIC [Erysipelotrichales bacterium]MBQ2310493.1 PTS transporter subunit EIIC [Erysipelotrichales bacterium]MBQ2478012.1 PTS transporter subunit EIIC [Erysipelotrichales bacterium]MBQ4011781.1 PTS transporter subunit EIIC [Erysipelotrichales bacterium]MBQ4375560.1 PTS transporter subunit EIIC [Erysipelotrichales bacterium]
MAKKDYKAIAEAIVANAGGVDNILNASHCMTRLRLQVKDGSKVDQTAAKSKAVEGVINLIVQNGEFQYVIGQDVPSVYEEISKIDGIKAGGTVDDAEATKADMKAAKGGLVNTILSYIGGTFSPIIPIFIAGGLTGAVLSLLRTFAGLDDTNGTVVVLTGIQQAMLWFLPVYIGFSSASRLKSNPYLGAFLGAVLLFQGTTAAAAQYTNFLGIPITAIGYNGQIFPVILGTLFMSVVYKFLQKHLPVNLRTIFVPLLTMLVTVPVTLIVLGPLGYWVGTGLANGVLAIYRFAPWLAVAIIGATTVWLVFFGMNNATYPVLFLLLAEVGSDPLICTGMAPANVAVGGACLAYALLAKEAEDKQVGTGAGITALCGITEPGVYGVLFPNRYPLIGAMVGGGLGGFIAGLFGLTQFVVANPGFLSFAAYMNPDGTWGNFWGMMGVMVLAVVVAFVVTWFLGKKALAKQAK